jgi:hypothetical protein
MALLAGNAAFAAREALATVRHWRERLSPNTAKPDQERPELADYLK